MVIFLAACGAEAQPAIVTPAPSATPLVTATHTPSATPTFEIKPTVTLAPTDTPQQVSHAAPTSPLRPTFTLAPATQTATFQPERVGLSVEYFITNTENPIAGETLTLFWRLNGANTARIFRLNEEDKRTQVWDVGTEGRLTVGTDAVEEAIEARFLLQGEANGSLVEEILVVAMQGNCPIQWFFQPPPEGCPSEVSLPTLQAEQHFENGLMLWLGASQEIYVFYTDEANPPWEVFADRFTEDQPIRDDSLVPPPDRLQPVRGFGLVWRENSRVRDRLGWAIEPEIGYDGIIQRAEETLYLRLRDGGIIAIRPDSWEVLPETAALDAVPPGDPSLITPTVETTPEQ